MRMMNKENLKKILKWLTPIKAVEIVGIIFLVVNSFRFGLETFGDGFWGIFNSIVLVVMNELFLISLITTDHGLSLNARRVLISLLLIISGLISLLYVAGFGNEDVIKYLKIFMSVLSIIVLLIIILLISLKDKNKNTDELINTESELINKLSQQINELNLIHDKELSELKASHELELNKLNNEFNDKLNRNLIELVPTQSDFIRIKTENETKPIKPKAKLKTVPNSNKLNIKKRGRPRKVE